MLKLRGLILLIGLCVPGLTALAGTNYITLDGYQVHPTRIVARYKAQPGIQARAVPAEAAGMVTTRNYSLVPGLVVFDVQPGLVHAQDFDPDAAAKQLSDRITALRNSGAFLYVEPDYRGTNYLTPNDASFVDGTLWSLRNLGQFGGTPGADIGVTNAWDLTTGSTNIIVAIVDTGIRYTHQDLAAQMWHNPGEVAGNGKDDDGNGYIDDVFGINAINNNGDPFDDNDHGTHTAGTIGAAANNGFPHVGISWKVQLMACKWLDSTGSGFYSDAIQCMDYAIAKGARIINASWGGGPFNQALFDSISRVRDKGVLFVAAAGNSSSDNDAFPDTPSSYQLDNIIAVAAIDRNDQLASFSSFGRTNVNIGAPGVEIYSWPAGSDSDYQFFDGTSMAAPHVCGVAALIMAYRPQATLQEVRERILLGSVPIPALAGKVSTGGRLNAYRALTLAPSGLPKLSITPSPGSSLPAGTNVPIFVKVTDLFGITNATVSATIPGVTNITFVNNGVSPDQTANDSTYSALFAVPATTGPLTVTFNVSAPGESNLTQTVTYNLVIPPPNDAFVNATKVPPQGAIFDVDNTFATLEPSEPLHAGDPFVDASLWWVWSPKTNGPVIVDTAGSAFDSVVAVYVGSGFGTLREIASADNVGNKKQAYVMFSATNGVTYHIVVAGASSTEKGPLHLRVEPNGNPDTNAPIVTITSPPDGTTITNLDGKVRISGTAFDPAPNASGIKQVTVQLNKDVAVTASGTTNWITTNLLQIGVNIITVRATDFAENISQSKTITLTLRPQTAPNDLFGKAIELSGFSGSSSVVNAGTSKEFMEPNHAGNEGGSSVWWTYRPTVDGVLFLSTAGSTFDTLLGLYTGDRVSALTEVASNDDAPNGKYSELTHAVFASQVYHIAVDGFGGATGVVQIAYTFTAGKSFRLNVSSLGNGTVTPSGTFPTNAAVSVVAVPNQFYDFAGFQNSSGTLISLDNPLSVVLRSDSNIVARFTPHVYSDDFESGGFGSLPWQNSGWSVQSAVVRQGTFSASSGSTGDNETHSLILTANTRAGTGRFDFKVSSEANWDKFEFLTNGVVSGSWSGEVDWTTYSFDVADGLNTFEWHYRKDPARSEGLDAAFLDVVDLPLRITPSAPRISFEAGRIHIQGVVNQQYVIQGSTDLVHWTSISTNIANSTGIVIVADPNSGGNSARFYRALVQ